MSVFTRLLGLIFICGLCAPVFAQGIKPSNPDDKWSGELNFNYEKENGNTDSEDLGFDGKVAYTVDKWVYSTYAEATGELNDDVTTKEEYRFGLRAEYDWSDPNYLFGSYDWKKDRFGAVEEQATLGGGIGRNLIRSEKHHLKGEVGLGFRQTDFADNTDENEPVLLLAADYRWTITDNAEFTQTVDIESGEENTYTFARSRLKMYLTGSISINIGWELENNSEAPAGRDNTDTTTTIGIGYIF